MLFECRVNQKTFAKKNTPSQKKQQKRTPKDFPT